MENKKEELKEEAKTERESLLETQVDELKKSLEKINQALNLDDIIDPFRDKSKDPKTKKVILVPVEEKDKEVFYPVISVKRITDRRNPDTAKIEQVLNMEIKKGDSIVPFKIEVTDYLRKKRTEDCLIVEKEEKDRDETAGFAETKVIDPYGYMTNKPTGKKVALKIRYKDTTFKVKRPNGEILTLTE